MHHLHALHSFLSAISSRLRRRRSNRREARSNCGGTQGDLQELFGVVENQKQGSDFACVCDILEMACEAVTRRFAGRTTRWGLNNNNNVVQKFKTSKPNKFDF